MTEISKFNSIHVIHDALFYFIFFKEKHLVLLRDGRTLIGILRSIDQFGM